jgi:homoserine dehydrogenase
MKTIRIGLAGFGTVGSAVYKNLPRSLDLFAHRCGIRPVITAIAVRNPRKKRSHGIHLPKSMLVSNMDQLVDHANTDMIVEVMGGYKDAKHLVLSALRKGKPVVTANKALLAEKGSEIFSVSSQCGVPIYFEASVAGGIPIIQAIREGLIANQFKLIYGIVNGTSNYILTRMSQEKLPFEKALQQAQDLGYAEADPSFDIDGVDAAHKATILASLAFGGAIDFRQVYVEGIRSLSVVDVQFAHLLGYEIKLLAVIRGGPSSKIEVRVHPTLIPRSNHLASIHGVTNSVMVRGDVVGDIEFSGPGAGGNATSSSVLSDIAQAASYIACASSRSEHHQDKGWLNGFIPSIHKTGPGLKKIDEIESRFYLRFSVTDRPGVMAQISSVLGKLKIGISSIIQPEGHEGKSVPLIFMSHDARNDAMQKALKQISRLQCVKAKPIMLRVENFET